MKQIEQELSEHRCECGKPLYVVRNKNGKVLGVTHTEEDEDHHYQHTANMMNAIKNNSN